VEREIRAGRYAWLPPIAVTVLVGGGALVWAARSGERTAVQVATATWVFIAITWITSLALFRRIGGRRAPEATTTTAFLDFTIRVCRSTRASIAAGAALYSLFLAFMLFWRYQSGPFTSVGEYLLSTRVVVMAVVTVLLAVAGWRRYRRLGTELNRLLATQWQFRDVPEVSADQPRTGEG
jgi:hypothetical protein